jgi:diketogulonate reductase-like aldo/keto reductase
MTNKDIPKIIYGTAWKEAETERLVITAVKNGFRGIDTANQRRHYVEALVGSAIEKILKDGVCTRAELFIQTKFTYAEGQDHRIPYEKSADHSEQIRQSFLSSLEHLLLDKIDSYILHGPYSHMGITEVDWKVWREMETIHKEGKTKYLGVSNVSIDQLKELYNGALIKPSFVQNRCFAQLGWDLDIRNFCANNNITYQGFSLLTANPFVLSDSNVRSIAKRLNKTPAQIVFRFAMQVGLLPLTGTTNPKHMKEDLKSIDFSLTEDEVSYIERIGF